MAQVIREPKQKRSIAKRRQIMDTARRVFSELGFEAMNSNQLAHAAGVSTGTFYCYFENKEDLLYALVEDSLNYMFKGNFTKMPGQDVDFVEATRSYVASVFEAFSKDPAFLRFVISKRFTDQRICSLFTEVTIRESESAAQILKAYDRDRVIPDYTLAGSIMVGLVNSSARALYVDLTINRDPDVFIEEVTRIILGALKTSLPQKNKG